MNPEDIKELVDQLLKTGEILATKAFELAVQQVYVEAVQFGMLTIALMVISWGFGKYLYREGKQELKEIKEASDYYHSGMKEAEEKMAYGILFMVVFALLSLIPLSMVVGRLMNPQWYAIEKLLTTLFN